MQLLLLSVISVTGFSQVKLEKNGIYIAPGTKISSEDQAKINSILASYDVSLYKFTVVKNNRVVSTAGKSRNLKLNGKVAYSPGSRIGPVAADCTISITVCHDNTKTNEKTADKTNEKNTVGKRMQQQLLREMTAVLAKYQ